MHEEYQNLLNEKRGLANKTVWTPEDEARNTAIDTRMTELRAEIQRDNTRREARNSVADHDAFLNGSGSNNPIELDATPNRVGDTPEVRSANEQMKSAVAVARRSGRTIKDNEIAFRGGMFLRATLGGSTEARKFCKAKGIEVRATRHMENDNASGGFLVPTELDNEILDTRERYGIIRGLAKTKGMGSDTRNILRKEGGLTAVAVGEGKKGAVSKGKWGQVELKAKRFQVLARMTSELNEDSAIDLANDFVEDMGLAFAKMEDFCAFIGDGTSVYNGITGVIPTLLGLSATKANIAGLQPAAGNSWDSITAANLLGMLARAATYVFDDQPVWICSSQFYFTVFERIIESAGGTTRFEIINGKPQYFYKGFRVIFSPAMPSTSQAGGVPLLFGSPSKGIMFGDRRGITIAQSDSATVEGDSLFETEETAIRATERFDIVFHDAGNATANANDRKGGSLVGLLLGN